MMEDRIARLGKKRSWSYAALLVLATAVYWALDYGSQRAGAAWYPYFSPMWLPAGYGFALLLVHGYRYWPAIFIGAIAASHMAGASLPVSAGIALANTLASLLGAWLLFRYAGFRPQLPRVRDVLSLIFIGAVVGRTVSATLAAGSIWLGGAGLEGGFSELLLNRWMGGIGGVLVLTPFLLAFSEPLERPRGWKWYLEALALLGLLTIVGAAVFTSAVFPTGSRYPLAFVPLLFVVWVGLRFEVRGSTVATLLLAAISVMGTLSGAGPFAGAARGESLLLLELFIAVVAVTGLVLAAAVEELRRERSLREGLALLDQVVNLLPVGIWIADREGRVTASNPIAERIWGEGPTTAYAGWGGALQNKIEARQWLLAPAIEKGETVKEERIEVRSLTGANKLLLSSAIPMRDASGGIAGAVAVHQDVTNMVRAEQSLRELATIVEQTDDMVIVTDRGGGIEYVNPAFQEGTGYAPEEVIGRTPSMLKSGRHDKDFYENLWGTIVAGKPFQGVLINRKKSGALYYEHKTISPIRNDEGEITHFVSTGKDITEREQTVETLRRLSRARGVMAECSRLLVRAKDERELLGKACRIAAGPGGYHRAWIGMVEHDEAKTIRRVASAGYVDAELPAMQISWGDGEFGRGLAGRAVRSGAEQVSQNVETDPNLALWRVAAMRAGIGSAIALPLKIEGEVIAVLWIGSAEPDAFDAEEIALLEELASDIAYGVSSLRAGEAKRRAEEDLERSEAKYRGLVEQAMDGIFVHDGKGNFLFVNPRLCQMLGYSEEELLRLNVVETFPEEERKDVAQLLSNVDPFKVMEKERMMRREDGACFPAEISVRYLPNGNHQGIVHDITERRRAEEELRRFRAAMDASADIVFLVDPVTMRYIDVNDGACRALGYSRAELLALSPTDIVPESRENLDRSYNSLIAGDLGEATLEGWYRRKDGSRLPIELARRAVLAAQGHVIVVVARDITERKAQERRIARLTRIRAVLGGINSAFVRLSERDELFHEACRIAVEAGKFSLAWIGVVDREAMRIRPVAWHGAEGGLLEIARGRLSLGQNAVRHGMPVRAVMEKKAAFSNDIENDPQVLFKKELLDRGIRSHAMLPILVSGEAVALLVLCAAEVGFFDDEEVKLLEELAGDIAFTYDHLEKEKRLNYLAYYDSLTGLANRTLFHERLDQALRAAARAEGKLAVLALNIDRFKNINDSLGRQIGDALLRQIAERVSGCVGGPNLVARVSADSFAVLLPEVKAEDQVARTVEEELRSCFGSPFRLDGQELRISAKIGIALFPNDGADADTLFKNAEAALKKAKTSGEPYLFFAKQMTERVAEKLALENKLRQALEKEEFVLHYQPVVDIETGRISGMEALIRWMSPELGLVPPMDFIPLMEETGLILEVGAWALHQAVLDYAYWVEQGMSAPRVAVNVSPIQLRKRDFVAVVDEALKRGAAPIGIDLEITESLIMEDIEENIEKLRAIRALGVSVAVDDFGTGHSSLGYLARLPVDSLKIDRSFIITMANDPNAMTLVSTIITLAHSLNLKVVAEGVDSEEQAKFLRLLRCDQMQGYLFSRPLPREEATILLKQGQPPGPIHV